MTTGIGLVGFGYWGVNLARNVHAADNCELVIIVEPDEARATRAKDAYPDVPTVASLEEALSRDDVEALIVATPAATHAALGERILEAGRHVMLEKPLAMSSADARRLLEKASAGGLTIMVGHTFLYAEPVRWLCSSIRRGDLGDVQYMSFQRLSLGRIRTDCNALWNLAPHDVSIALFLLGERPDSVSANGYSFLQPGINDVYFASMRFPSGRAVGLQVSWLDPRKERLVTVVGSEKMAVYNDVSSDRKIEIFDSGVAREGTLGEYGSLGDFQWRTRTGDIHIPRLELEEPLLREVREFATAIQERREPATPGAQGADVVAILEALDRSADAGGTAKVPEYFVADTWKSA